MGPGEAQPGGELRLPVAVHVPPELVRQCPGVRPRVLYGGDRLIPELQRFPSSGALPVTGGGGFRQAEAELMAVPHQRRPQADHLLAELRQGLQQAGPLVVIPEDAGFLLPCPLIPCQGGGVPGAELAEGGIQEAPPGGGPLPDEEKVLRLEQHRVVHVSQGRVGLYGDLVDGELPPLPPEQIRLDLKLPVPGIDPGQQPGGVRLEADHLPVRPGPGGLSPGEVDQGLQQVRLPLGVFAADHIAPGIEVRGLPDVIPEALQLQAVNPHSGPPGFLQRRPPCPRGGFSSPAGGRAPR